jgi:hypothetical protein
VEKCVEDRIINLREKEIKRCLIFGISYKVLFEAFDMKFSILKGSKNK